MRIIKPSPLLKVLALVLFLASQANGFPLSPGSEPVKKALGYFKASQQDDGGFGQGGTTEWVMIAIAAAGQDPRTWYRNGKTPLDYLKERQATENPYEWIRLVLTLTSIGEDPRRFNGQDYVEKIKKRYVGGQFGDPLSLRDDYWAALALISAGQRESKHVKESVRFILKHQNRDGSWGASMTGIEICPDNTAAAILVLMAAGQKADSKAITRGLHYLRKAQNQDGGFSYLFVPSNAATDSAVIQAIRAAEQNPGDWGRKGKDVLAHLLGLQSSEGSFKWTGQSCSSPLMMTAHAVAALLGKYPPFKSYSSSYLTVDVRIEGRDRAILQTQVTTAQGNYCDTKGKCYRGAFPTPLSVLSEAVEGHNISYLLEQQPLGPFLKDLQGESGYWQYRVNDVLPWIAAHEYRLRGGDDVVWFFDPPEYMSPLRMLLDRASTSEGGAVGVRVDQYDDAGGQWKEAVGAQLVVRAVDCNEPTCGENIYPVAERRVIVTFPAKGTYSLYAEKRDAVRSVRKLFRVEASETATVKLVIEDGRRLLWKGPVSVSATTVKDVNGENITVTQPVLLAALEAARLQGAIAYKAVSTAQGVILYSVNGLEENNTDGSWWYVINGENVFANVDEAPIRDGDTVLFYRSKRYRH